MSVLVHCCIVLLPISTYAQFSQNAHAYQFKSHNRLKILRHLLPHLLYLYHFPLIHQIFLFPLDHYLHHFLLLSICLNLFLLNLLLPFHFLHLLFHSIFFFYLVYHHYYHHYHHQFDVYYLLNRSLKYSGFINQ